MKKGSLGLSLRYKLLLVLTIIPIVVLGLYLFMATRLFERDKIAYVYESSVSVASSLATQVKLEMESYFEKVKAIIEELNPQSGEWTTVGRDLFSRQSRISALVVFQHEKDGSYRKVASLAGETGFESDFLDDDNLLGDVRQAAIQDNVHLTTYLRSGKHLVVGQRLGSVDTPGHKVLLALVESEDLFDAFAKSTLYRTMMIDRRGKVAIASAPLTDLAIDFDETADIFAPILKSEVPKGTVEFKSPNSRAALASYTDARVGGMLLVTIVDKKAALEAVQVLVRKSLLFFVALIATTLVVSLFASFSLTSTLRELFEATRKIALGQFDVRVRSRSRDEVGGLAESFNWMAEEVSRLLNETAQKARMENELATVKAVQETLFPPSRFDSGPVHIAGHFEPASECGGDWWSYSRVDDRVFLWIGDATGHGAPAALITSAAKSAASIVESIPDISPSRALEIMNSAIYETSKGQIMMTFFLGVLNLKTGKLTYANASHDPPYLLRKMDQPLTKKDLVPLMDVNGPRLGDKKGSTYQETEIQLNSQDTILFYTDGVLDVQDAEGKPWGERQFLKSVMAVNATTGSVEEKVDLLRLRIAEYREASELIDDVTLFMCQYEDVA